MKFATGLVSLALAAAGASALPSRLGARQAGVVYVRFYNEPLCGGNWVEDTVYFDDTTGICDPETLSIPYVSWDIIRNEAIRDLNIYIGDSTCSGDEPIEIAAGETGCHPGRIGSTQFV